MSTYIVEYHIKRSDKHGERGHAIIKDGRNGEKLYSSEKYKNVAFGKQRTLKTYRHLVGAEFKLIDHRKQ